MLEAERTLRCIHNNIVSYVAGHTPKKPKIIISVERVERHTEVLLHHLHQLVHVRAFAVHAGVSPGHQEVPVDEPGRESHLTETPG